MYVASSALSCLQSNLSSSRSLKSSPFSMLIPWGLVADAPFKWVSAGPMVSCCGDGVGGEIILFHDTSSFVDVTRKMNTTSPLPSRCSNPSRLHAETKLPISFKHPILPKKSPPPTPVLELQPLPISALHNKEYETIYVRIIQTSNTIQTQFFQVLYTSDENVFVSTPMRSGKTICAEFALFKQTME